MEHTSLQKTSPTAIKDSLLRRKYVIPFILACVILFCNTAVGINSIVGYNTDILLQSGLSDLQAHWGYVLFTLTNFLMTIAGMTLVDRKGRKLLLTIGTSGIIVCLLFVGLQFLRTEKTRGRRGQQNPGNGWPGSRAFRSFHPGRGTRAAGRPRCVRQLPSR